MRHFPLRWALMCVAATSALLATSAEATERVTIGPGDSLDSLARRFGVSKLDIARANDISVEAVLRDGRKLVIPDPPRTVTKSPTMHRQARVVSDRVTVRRGPYEGYRRLTLVDSGDSITATARAGDWVQVTLSGGKSGWIRQDFLSIGSSTGRSRTQVARRESPSRAKATSERRSAGRSTATRSASRPSARRVVRHREEQRPRRTARRSTPTRTATGSAHRTRTATADRRGSRSATRVARASGDVVRTAYTYRGTPYRYGGSGGGGFDCSGFTRHVYAKKGVSLPHNARAQFGRGRSVSRGELKEGDLVFFHTTRRGISHVGIYAGNGRFVHASSGGGSVRVDTLDSGYYKERFRGGRRVR